MSHVALAISSIAHKLARKPWAVMIIYMYIIVYIYIHSHSFENIRESWLDGFQPIFFVIFTIHHPEMEFAVHLVLHGWDESCGPKVAPGSLP